MNYDRIIIGAGIFGLYAAQKSLENGESVLVLEYDDIAFKRASWINQARVHNGYHYPRSYSTAKKSSYYFDRFVADYGFAVLQDFTQVYATSKKLSYTSAKQFAKFCDVADIPCKAIAPEVYFKPEMCDGAFATLEYAFDAKLIGEYMLKKLSSYTNFAIKYNVRLSDIKAQGSSVWQIVSNLGVFTTAYLINATYASLNQILGLAGIEPFKMKYELCEIVLCKVSNNIQNIGLTVMDGPFFSLVPFGKTGFHCLTTVVDTPHLSSRSTLPTFSCQEKSKVCRPRQLANCNDCPYQPLSDFTHMYKLAKSYLNEDIEIKYHKALFSMKAVLLASEIDDARPTIIRFSCQEPKFLSVFSGKIDTIYDLDEVL